MNNNTTVAAKTYGIGLKDKLGYALGDTGGVLLFSLVGSFLQMFYTDILFIDPERITILFFVARLWDAINDPMWGAIVDSRKPGKNGKFRPYLKWGSIPMAIFGVLMFVEIPGLTDNQYLVFAYITYIGYGMLYTVVNIPYGSLASVITTDEEERSALSTFRSIGAGLGGLPGQIILPLFVYSTSVVTGERILDGSKLLMGVALLAAVSVVIYQFSYRMIEERVVSPPTAKKVDIKKTILTLLKNKPFIALCIASMLLIATQQYQQTIYNYLFKDYFAQPEKYSLVTIFTYLPMALVIPIMPKILRHFGKKETCTAAMILAFAANLGLWLIGTKSVTVFFVFSFFSGLGLSFFVLQVWALVTDVIDYQEMLSGQRDEGTSFAFFSFFRKLGQTLAGILGTRVLVSIGYSAQNITPEVSESMYNVATLIPAILCLGMVIALGPMYPLSKKKLKELKEKKI